MTGAVVLNGDGTISSSYGSMFEKLTVTANGFTRAANFNGQPSETDTISLSPGGFTSIFQDGSGGILIIVVSGGASFPVPALVAALPGIVWSGHLTAAGFVTP